MRNALAAIVVALLSLDITGASAQNWPAGLPTGYRQLFADYLAAHNRYVVRDAKITPPYERSRGLFRSGTYTVTCIAVFRDNPLGVVVRDNWVLRFEDGQVKEIGLGTEPCSPLSPFPELLTAIANSRHR